VGTSGGRGGDSASAHRGVRAKVFEENPRKKKKEEKFLGGAISGEGAKICSPGGGFRIFPVHPFQGFFMKSLRQRKGGEALQT